MWNTCGTDPTYTAIMPGQPDTLNDIIAEMMAEDPSFAAMINAITSCCAPQPVSYTPPPVQQPLAACSIGHMDINQIRNLPEMQAIAQYLRDMNLKKNLFGGCDKESVLRCILEVTKKYEAILVELFAQQERKDREIAFLQSELSGWPKEALPNYAEIGASWQAQFKKQELMIAELRAKVEKLDEIEDLAKRQWALIQQLEHAILSLPIRRTEVAGTVKCSPPGGTYASIVEDRRFAWDHGNERVSA